MRVAYTLEQCWHRVPGGTGVAAMRVAEAMTAEQDVTLLGVAGRHAHVPSEPWSPVVPIAHLPVGGPLLYDLWLRRNWPKVERATGPIDIAHATTLIPCATDAKMVVTVHDLAFLHDPSQFTRRGNSIFRRSLEQTRRRADLVLCSSQATMDDCAAAGLPADRLRLVPLGVDVDRVDGAESARVTAAYGLPQRYLLFVGTVEPRKNLRGLVDAVSRLEDALPLIVAGAHGWGDVAIDSAGVDIRFIGFVPADDLAGLYAGAEVFCYPSQREGYGLPVLEAMAQGTPVVTSRGTATEEAAGGAAVLVDPMDPDDIARGITEARARREPLSSQGVARADRATWRETARLTADAYRELC
ncbi:MAG: glycosyltransferase family 1 protein [Ilumatobacteraceae bacterium]